MGDDGLRRLAMSLATPEKIRNLQRKLYLKAKQEPGFRFYQLYDKVYRADLLEHAYLLCKSNGGSSGVDGVTFEQIEASGRVEWLERLGKELHDKTYKPDPVRRVMIPKPGGGERPRGLWLPSQTQCSRCGEGGSSNAQGRVHGCGGC
jgi:RNA-directed DNA polymerase